MAARGIAFSKSGLSPLARGTRFTTSSGFMINRFIPAGAGNTRWKYMLMNSVPVYPRWRGEHTKKLTNQPDTHGLSPLARGTRRQMACLNEFFRFIPAGAGNTDYQKTYWNFYAVYPRWRGEHHSTSEHKPGCVGLSPLAWGTLTGLWIARLLLRFIPAGAGNTCRNRWMNE